MQYHARMDAAARQTLDKFLQAIDALRVHRDAEGRPSLKKPLLLLLVLSKLEKGSLTENRIHFTDIERDLTLLIKRHGRRGDTGAASPDEPFVYLGTASFWHLHYPPGTPNDRKARRSKKVLRDPATYATLDADVFAVLRDKDARAEVLRHIAKKWWGSDTLPTIT